MADIADAIEGQLFPMFCLEPSITRASRILAAGCRGFWGEVARAIKRVFEETTVADLVARHQQSNGTTVFTSEQLLSRLG